MSTLGSLFRFVVVEITAADASGVLDLICRNDILLYDLASLDELTVRFRVNGYALKKLALLLDRHAVSWHVISHGGLFWSIRSLYCRPLLVLGLVVFLMAAFILPGRVFFVRVEGNSRIHSRQILEAASDLGVKFGASGRYVRSERVKNGLLSELDQLEWAGVNTKGCVAIVSVKERKINDFKSGQLGFGDVVALRDGVILKCDVVRGNGICAPGQAVKEGETLISGTLDHGSSVTFTLADGEIYAMTKHQISALSYAGILVRGIEESRSVKYSLLIGKKLINFFKGSGISSGTCVKMYSKYVLTLPGGFTLPVAFVKQVVCEAAIVSEERPERSIKKFLSNFASGYLRDHMIAGSIQLAHEQIILQEDVYQLTGNYTCTEMIGRVQQEQIGAYNGKTD